MMAATSSPTKDTAIDTAAAWNAYYTGYYDPNNPGAPGDSTAAVAAPAGDAQFGFFDSGKQEVGNENEVKADDVNGTAIASDATAAASNNAELLSHEEYYRQWQAAAAAQAAPGSGTYDELGNYVPSAEEM
ncbi:hypothetical protein HDV05_002000, partial [Chytridiales sp. JEL 0842]